MRKWIMAAALALVLVPAAALAQENGRMNGQMAPGMYMGRGMGMGMNMAMMNPAAMVLSHQAELSLTPAQLEKLGKIRDEFQKENAEALAKIQKEHEEIVKKYGEGPYTAEQRAKMQDERGDIREARAQLMKNRREAMEDVRDVLTPAQQTRLQEVMRAQMGRMHGPEGQAPGRMHDQDH